MLFSNFDEIKDRLFNLISVERRKKYGYFLWN